jgi:hypothetical protein
VHSHISRWRRENLVLLFPRPDALAKMKIEKNFMVYRSLTLRSCRKRTYHKSNLAYESGAVLAEKA